MVMTRRQPKEMWQTTQAETSWSRQQEISGPEMTGADRRREEWSAAVQSTASKGGQNIFDVLAENLGLGLCTDRGMVGPPRTRIAPAGGNHSTPALQALRGAYATAHAPKPAVITQAEPTGPPFTAKAKATVVAPPTLQNVLSSQARISVPRDTRNAVEGSYDGSYESYSYSYSAAAAPAGAPAFGSYETAPAAAPRPTSDAEYEYSEYTYSPPSDMPPAAR